LVNVRRGISVENVEVRGLIMGLPEEEGVWKYPHVLHLGQLRAGVAYQFLLRVVVPIPCRVTSNISGLEVTPANLPKGPIEVSINIEALPRDTLLQGTISLTTTFVKRSIQLDAMVPSADHELDADFDTPADHVVWEPWDWWSLTGGTPPPSRDVRPRSTPIK